MTPSSWHLQKIRRDYSRCRQEPTFPLSNACALGSSPASSKSLRVERRCLLLFGNGSGRFMAYWARHLLKPEDGALWSFGASRGRSRISLPAVAVPRRFQPIGVLPNPRLQQPAAARTVGRHSTGVLRSTAAAAEPPRR